jgi:serine/threonine protein kinase
MNDNSQYQVGDLIAGEHTVRAVFGGENESGMGVVYLIETREFPFPVVFKTYQHVLDESSRQRFIVEATAWVRAGAHRNLVQAFWVREIASHLFIAAEYVAPDSEGRNTLADYLAEGAIPLEILLTWATQFCLGMEYAQSRGILAHRDIKPENLMIDLDGNLKVADFGLAKTSERDRISSDGIKRELPPGSLTYTRTGSAMGTMSYMAPEQFADAKAVDHRADIYAFGVVMYIAVTGGQYPYELDESENPPQAFFDAHLNKVPRAVRTALWPVIECCLKKNPAHRYESYDAMIHALRRIADSLQITIPESIHIEREDEELYAQAQSFVALGSPNLALSSIDEYVSKYPNNHCGWTDKSRIHLELREFDKSIQATRRSLDLHPYNSHAWNNLGVALTAVKAPYDQIKYALDHALQFDPHNTGAMLNFVGPLIDKKDYIGAAAITVRAMELRPEKPLVLGKADSLVSEFFAQREFDAAELLLTGWVRARPHDGKAWHNLGLLFLESGRTAQAIAAFVKIETIDPSDNFAVTQLARLFFKIGVLDQCIRRCDLLLARQHQVPFAIDAKARAIEATEGPREADRLLAPYLEQFPQSDPLWVLAAKFKESYGDPSGAIDALLQARIAIAGGDSEYRSSNLSFIENKLRELRPQIGGEAGSAPAISDRIRTCIRKSREVTCAATQVTLNALLDKPMAFESVFAEIPPGTLTVKWNGSLIALIQPICLVATRLVLYLIFAIFTPVAFGIHLIKHWARCRALKARIKELQAIPALMLLTDTVSELWRLHGLDDSEYSVKTQVDLLAEWIDVLYGQGTSRRLLIQERARTEETRRCESKLRILRETIDLHFHYVPVAQVLAADVSNELPRLH